jgi:hypothetical protein
LVAQEVEQEKQTIDLRVERDSNTKAIQKLQASRAWAMAQAKRLELIKQRNEACRTQLQKWLSWTLGNMHRASNGTTFFYLVWTPIVVFWSVMIAMAVPTAVACPQPDGICHRTRVLALEAKKVVLLPQMLMGKLIGN